MQEKNNASMDLNTLNEEVQQLQQQLTLLRQEHAEINAIIDSLANISELKKKEEILVSVGGGVFIPINIEKLSSVLVNVGGDVMLKKTMPDARSMVEKQAEDLQGYIGDVEKELSKRVMLAKMLHR